jgi:hypothetical protein
MPTNISRETKIKDLTVSEFKHLIRESIAKIFQSGERRLKLCLIKA